MARSLTSPSGVSLIASMLLALVWPLAGAGFAQEGYAVGAGDLVASDAVSGDEYGLAVEANGTHAAVGAPGRSEAALQAGAVYTFTRVAGQWLPRQKLLPPLATEQDRFGLALSLEGDTLLVGAPGSDASRPDAGAAFLYHFDGSQWVHARTLRSPLPEAASRFGQAVEARGDFLFVGAPYHDAAGTNAGAVFVFDRFGQPVDGPRVLYNAGIEAGDEFGSSLACEASTLVIGAPGRATMGSWSGGAYVFLHQLGAWREVYDLTPTDLQSSSFFGRSVAIEDSRLLVGAAGDSQEQFLSGAVYGFEFGGDGWIQTQKLKARLPRQGAQFGFSVDLALDRFVVGARYDPELAANAGRVFLFTWEGTGWAEAQSIGEIAPGHNHWFGAAVALLPGEVIVGAPHAQGATQDSGMVHVLSLQPGVPFCFGDGDSGICPCGNESIGMGGCENSAGDGAHLYASGTSSAQGGSLAFHLQGARPGRTALLAVGDVSLQLSGSSLFGDGLLCVAGPRPLGVRVVGAGGVVDWSGTLVTSDPAWDLGETRAFQAIYRDVATSPCGFGFNTSNAYAIERAP